MEEIYYAFQQEVGAAYALLALCDREESACVHGLLRRAGLSLFSFAFTSDAALAWARRIRPNVQVLSSNYPNMRGLDLYDQLCHVSPEPPVPTLLLGARRLHIQTPSGHCIICLERPYVPEQLLDAVETLLRHDLERLGRLSSI